MFEFRIIVKINTFICKIYFLFFVQIYLFKVNMQEKIRDIVQCEKAKFHSNLKALTGDKSCNPRPSEVGLLAMLDEDFPKYNKHRKVCDVQVIIIFF